MEERTLFDRIHQALDVEPRPGAYERLRIALANSQAKPQPRPVFSMRWPQMGLRVAAFMTVVVLAIAAAAVFLAAQRVADRSTPADSAHAIAAYKLMLSDDYSKIPAGSVESTCFGDQFAACEADVSLRIPVANQIQNDLNRFQPPERFAIAVAQMRRHNALQIRRLDAVLAASQAQDAVGMDRAVAAVVSGRPWMDTMFNSILSSQQGTVAVYVESVRNEKRDLDKCVECQDRAGLNQTGCVGSQAPSCQPLLESTAATVASFQNAVVRVAAPSSLATKDNRLQLDLATADTALLTMGEALSAGDQAGFNAGRVSLKQAMAAINVDAANILNG